MAAVGYLTQAKVIRTVSVYGVYDVLANSGTRFKSAIAVSETSACLYGVKTSITYQPGSLVVLYVPAKEETGGDIAFILGAACDNALPPEKNPYAKLAVLNQAMARFINRADTSLKYVPEGTNLENDFSYGRASELFPGEWAKSTYLGGGFFLNDFMASMGVHERARIDMIYFDDLIRFTAGKTQNRIASCDGVVFLEKANLYNEVLRAGATMRESLGSLDGSSPVVPSSPDGEDPYTLECISDRDFFNYQRISGDLSQGVLETYTVPGTKVDIHRPAGVLSVYKGYQGVYELRAASSISHVKTAVIPVPQAVEDPDTELAEDDYSDYSPESYPLKAGDPPGADLSFFGALGSEEKYEHDLEKDSFTKFRARDKIWSVPEDSAEVLSDLKNAGVDVSKELELPPLDITKPFYDDAPASGLLKAEVDEDGKRQESHAGEVFNITSSVRQLPDGSVVISGGWGEEIRMYRGNIYITCPGDIITQPGRDYVSMAGGNSIHKANKGTLELEGKSITALAQGNMQLAAAADGGAGTMMLENKSQALPNMGEYAEKMKDNQPSGGGIIIKSRALAAVSDSIQVSGEGTGGDPIKGSTLSIKMGGISVVTEEAVTYLQGNGRAVTVGQGCLLGVGGGSVSMVGDNGVRVNSPQLLCQSGNVKIPFVDKEDNKTSLNMGGGRQASLSVEKGIISQSVQSRNMAVDGGYQKIGDNGKGFAETYSRIFSKPPPGSAYVGLQPPGTPITEEYKHKKLAQWGIVLPVSRYPALSLPENRWQNMVGDKGGRWEEMEIPASFDDKEPAMAYPGIDNMQADGSLKKLNKKGKVVKGKLSEDLVINSK